MIIMILKMMAIIAIHIIITLLLWKIFKKNNKMTIGVKILIGIIFGLCAIFSNHFNVNYGHSLLNIRDLSPLVAGLFFDPISGIIAGVIGGVERFIIGEFFDIGAYTRYACSIATILAGLNAALLSKVVFKKEYPKAIYALFIGAVTEVLHMYLVLLTHNQDMLKALEVVKNNSIPMITFTAIGLMLTSIVIQVYSKEWRNPFGKKEPRETQIIKRFRFWLFIFCIGSLIANYIFIYMLQTHAAIELTNGSLADEIVYDLRDTAAYEILFSNIIMLALLYILVSMLINQLVVHNINRVNTSLRKITSGNLDEKVTVYDSSEFTALSDDVNKMVDTLKGYIKEAEKRNEQELLLSKSIQESALPKKFDFERKDFDIYATMNPTKEVGGDFYDFFFIGPSKLVLVIADVSGKGFPAALFMMRAKTAIRTIADQGMSPSEILKQVNLTLCEGNDKKMFVTVWLGIIDLSNGVITCSNAGHEYPILKSFGNNYELFKDKHSTIIGLRKKTVYKEYDITLNSGDAIFVYTDGIPEAINSKEEAYGLDRLVARLNNNNNASSKEIIDSIEKDVYDFIGEAEQFDDITMLGFRYNK